MFRMQIRALETFLCVAETGGFHAAARKLNVTQTAVSARIRQLENVTGKPLFRRGAGGATLTEFGGQFKPYAEQMLSLWFFAARELPGQSQGRVALRLGAQLSIWDPMLVDLAVQFEHRFSKLLLTLNYDHTLHMADAVASHVLDMALTTEQPVHRDLAWHALTPERLILVEAPAPPDSDRDPVFVNLELGETYAEHVRTTARHAASQTVFLGNCMMALRYILQRGGRGYFPQAIVAPNLDDLTLQTVAGAPVLDLPVYLLSRRDEDAQALTADVLQCLQDLRGSGQAGVR